MISPPACYGKLPALGDYLRHRAPGDEVGLWWNRFGSLPTVPSATTMVSGVSGASGETLPWCFVLAPDVLSWASGVHVIGVLMLSRDRIGRPYPLVVWQKASPAGLRHASLFGTESPRNWLFWLSRLVFAHVRPVRSERSDPDLQNDFLSTLDQLWELFRPSWTARLGVSGKLPTDEVCQTHIGPYTPLADVEGVRFMPWAEWPETLWSPRALCWFWQQDHQGRYLRTLRDHHCSKRVVAAMLTNVD